MCHPPTTTVSNYIGMHVPVSALLRRTINHFSNRNLVDSDPWTWTAPVVVGHQLGKDKRWYYMILKVQELSLPLVSAVVWDSIEGDAAEEDPCEDDTLCDSKQFNHSAKVISRSLFWSQYLGSFLPHFLSCLIGVTISRNVFHSRRSQTLFLFLSRITKLRVPMRSSSVPHPFVLFNLKDIFEFITLSLDLPFNPLTPYCH